NALVSAGALEPDTVAPTFNGPAPVVDQTTSDPTGANVTFTLPPVTDDQDPAPTVTCDHASGSKFPVGSTLV
ncbi:HYR domain-containing protein, partial [Escherichia coli]